MTTEQGRDKTASSDRVQVNASADLAETLTPEQQEKVKGGLGSTKPLEDKKLTAN